MHLSYVRSVEMDSWSDAEIKSMKVGGNKRLLDFFEKHNISQSASISVKYKTATAELYRSMFMCSLLPIVESKRWLMGPKFQKTRL